MDIAHDHIMPRAARQLPPAAMLHLICRSNNGVRVFHNHRDFRRIKAILARCSCEAEIFIHHYVLMNTHFHLLAWSDDTKNVATFMKAVQISYHHYYRRRYPYRGHLWHGRYRSIAMKDEEQAAQCARYIELNAVYAGLCKDPRDYRWSSYHCHAEGKADSPICPILWTIESVSMSGEKKSAYREFILAGIERDYQRLKREFERERVAKIDSGMTNFRKKR